MVCNVNKWESFRYHLWFLHSSAMRWTSALAGTARDRFSVRVFCCFRLPAIPRVPFFLFHFWTENLQSVLCGTTFWWCSSIFSSKENCVKKLFPPLGWKKSHSISHNKKQTKSSVSSTSLFWLNPTVFFFLYISFWFVCFYNQLWVIIWFLILWLIVLTSYWLYFLELLLHDSLYHRFDFWFQSCDLYISSKLIILWLENTGLHAECVLFYLSHLTFMTLRD